MIFLYALFLFFPFCIADGVHEANVGKIDWEGVISIRTDSGPLATPNTTSSGFKYNSATNTQLIIINSVGVDLIPHLNEGVFKLKGSFIVNVAQRPFISWFSENFDFVVIPYRDGVQISGADFTASRFPISENPTPGLNYSFNMVFTDPTLATAESHVYSIEFWDCLNGQCKLDEYSKKTVKRGEAIITVNYTP